MNSARKLTSIKVLHTAIWIFYNVVIFYMLYAAITNKLDFWLWTGYALVVAEGIVLTIFKLTCPLTILARRYSNSSSDNFDIYLPNWLARHTKLIYSSLFVLIIAITIYQVIAAR